MTWNAFLLFLIRFSATFFVLYVCFNIQLNAQNTKQSEVRFSADSHFMNISFDSTSSTYPNPKTVLRRSMIIPGWGQITNKQVWKVPIVYGLLSGLTYYSINLTKNYHDYRAAYYNSFANNTDMRFGPTPGRLQGQNVNSLRSNRDFLRNRRDFIYVTIFLAYVLNVVDAYVFAHLRSFDVSDDLVLKHEFIPNTITTPYSADIPAISLKLNF